MRIIVIIMGIMVGVFGLFLSDFVIGSVLDSLEVTATEMGTLADPATINMIVGLFDLLPSACIMLCVALIAYGFLAGVSETPYTRGRY
jgi:hypothetical protein